jgi:hypothetical protein
MNAFGKMAVCWLAIFFLGSLLGAAQTPVLSPLAPSVIIHYQLPTDGLLPRTYLVTLAITEAKDSNWVISNFASGVVRTVTAENQGRFSEAWDGLDDNYMPAVPGSYGVKGIYMPAQKWAIDGQYHAVIPKLASTGSSWGQAPSEDALPGKIEGDPVDAPLSDVDVAANGKGVLAFEYLENGRNYFLTDFTKPVGYGQVITGYDSGVFAGATSACTDGESIWCFSTDGGTPFIARADGKPFGHQKTGRDNVYLPDGWVTGMAAWTDKATGRTVVFDAETGQKASDPSGPAPGGAGLRDGRVKALDSRDASTIGQWKMARPLGLAARQDRLYLLHGTGAGFEVLSLALGGGWEKAKPSLLFKVPAGIVPYDIEADSHGRVYLSDSAANHVYQFDAQGRRLRTYGRSNAQVDGHYDPQTFMAPEKLACWTDAQGQDRILVVEKAGPNRLSEWSGDNGQLLRQWVVPQTFANNGYAIDPHHPALAYLQGQRETLVRWKIDYVSGQWTPDAVWRGIGPAAFGGKLVQPMAVPRLVYRGDDAYLVFWRGYVAYHLEGDRLRACAAVLAEGAGDDQRDYFWRDLNGDGRVEPNEYRPYAMENPPGIFRYFGETWFQDLSLVCFGGDTPDIWRLAPTGFDRRGTPLFDPRGWRKLLTDEIFTARQKGDAPALRGGNEAGNSFNSAWASVVQAPGGDLYVSARSGPDFSANQGAQFKLSRYVPDGRGGYRQRWRVGRQALGDVAQSGQLYGSIYVSAPLNGLVPVIDNSRAGVMLYSEDGLYVDTLFLDDHLVAHDQMGAYWEPGEFFAGNVYSNRDNGKIYFALGKGMPQIFEAQGWSTAENPVHPLTVLDRTVSLDANEIAMPPEAALRIRGGAAAARIARFYPSPGGAPALDGSMRGWEACDPVTFGNGATQSVEARCLYDPEHLYVRWHARLGHDVEIRSLGLPEHLFAHDRAADTLGLYLQGDPEAKPGGAAPEGRPGDVRFVFGLFKSEGATHPAVLGMYPSWRGSAAEARTYRTPEGGSVSFAHVGLVPGVKTGYQLDADGQGFVLAAAIPREALPDSPRLDGWRTEGNFDANFGGHDRFWWSNADGSASRETLDEPTEARLYPGSWSVVQCLPMTALPIHSWMAIGPFGSPQIDRLDINTDRDQIIKILFGSNFPPDTNRDMSAVYNGPITHTRVAQRRVAWQKADISTDQVDFEKTIGWSGTYDEGTAYLLTHIYSPQAADVHLQVTQPDGQYAVHGQLNGRPLPFITEDGQPWTHLDPTQPLHLQSGWNELLLRRDFIWGDMTLGASLKADSSILWHLRVTGSPP